LLLPNYAAGWTRTESRDRAASGTLGFGVADLDARLSGMAFSLGTFMK
jgi:hypothetical protein